MGNSCDFVIFSFFGLFFSHFVWFFCNLVEEHMFKYEFILQQIDTRSAIHDSLDDL